MSQTFYSIENLNWPFVTAFEKAFVVPRLGRTLRTSHPKLVFLLNGSCIHGFEGGPMEKFEPGDILVAPCRSRQIYQPAKPGTARVHALGITFHIDALQAALASPPPVSEPENDILDFTRHHFRDNRHLHQPQDPEIQETLAQIRHEAIRALPGYRLRVWALCTNLTILTARHLATFKPSNAALAPGGTVIPNSGGTFLVSQAKEWLLRHLDDEVHLADIARYLQISEEHLSRTFKAVTGQSVFNYLRAARIEAAKRLLVTSESNVSQIAIQTGFSSVVLFSRNFKSDVGLSPLAYRREFGSKTPV